MDLTYLAEGFGWLLLVAGGTYSLLRILFARSIISFTDPLNVSIILLALYFSGALFIITIHPVNKSYVDVLILNVTFLLAAALVSRAPQLHQSIGLNEQRTHHFFFACFFLGLLLINLVVNQIFGIMPLFLGTQARSELGSTAIPSLLLLAPDIGTVLLLIYLLSDSRAVKRVSAAGVLVAAVSALLNGSKSALIVTSLLLLFSADYILHLRARAPRSKAHLNDIKRRISKTRRWMVVTSCALVFILPAYLIFVGADSGGDGAGGAIETFGTRLFGGFDNLAFIAFDDLDITSAKDVNLMEFYFYPLFKKFSFTPDFHSAGEYILYLATKNYDLATNTLVPSSNFAIELLLQFENMLAAGAIVIAASLALFTARRFLLNKASLSIVHVVLWASLIMSPLALLFDGAYFMIKFYMLFAFYLAFNSIENLFMWIRGARPHYKFY
jgi:hypothetical protein